MYHGRDSKAYAIDVKISTPTSPSASASAPAGDTKPLDLRWTNCEAIRMQCAVPPTPA